jgi:hypothetical protein
MHFIDVLILSKRPNSILLHKNSLINTDIVLINTNTCVEETGIHSTTVFVLR